MDIIEAKSLFCKPSDERALLAYGFKHIDYFYDMSSKLSSDDFLNPDHVLIYLVCHTLVHEKKVTCLDLTVVNNEAIRQGIDGQIENCAEYIKAISDMSHNVSDDNYDVFLQNVLEASTRLKLYLMLQDNMKDVVSNDKTSIDLIGRLEKESLDLSTTSKAIKEPREFSDGLEEWLEQRREKPVKISGIDTGFPIFNNQIDGLVPGTLLVIAARKKMGKSAFLTQMAVHIAYRRKKSVLYVDTELPFEQWRTRVLSNISGVKERDILHGGYDDDTYRKLLQYKNVIKGGKLFHEYMPGYSVDKIVALYKKYKAKEDIAVGMFDYIKEPDATSVDRQRKEYQVLGDVTTKLKDLSGELYIPFVTAVQLNRDNDIADSDRIARYADVICMWGHRTKEELEGGAPEAGGSYKLVIKDSRRGGGTPEAGISYKFFKQHITIKESPPDEQLIQFNTIGEYNNEYDDDKYYAYEGYEGYEDEPLQ